MQESPKAKPFELRCIDCNRPIGEVQCPELASFPGAAIVRPMIRTLALRFNHLEIATAPDPLTAIKPEAFVKVMELRCLACADRARGGTEIYAAS